MECLRYHFRVLFSSQSLKQFVLRANIKFAEFHKFVNRILRERSFFCFFLNFIDQKDKTSILQIWAKNKRNAYGVAPNTNYNNNKDIIDQYAY